MKDLIGDFQSAFASGRSINDNCIIAHEMLNYFQKRKKANSFSLILNMDLNKAYDRVS